MSVQFLVHEDGDSVGVITVEGVKAGQELTGWIMKEDKTITSSTAPISGRLSNPSVRASIFMSTTSRPKGGRSHAKVIFRLSPRQRSRGHS